MKILTKTTVASLVATSVLLTSFSATAEVESQETKNSQAEQTVKSNSDNKSPVKSSAEQQATENVKTPAKATEEAEISTDKTEQQSSNKTVDDIDWFVPHSANIRMIHSICDKIGFSHDKALTSLESYGNTSSATIPLALWLALKEGKLKKGDKLALYGFGGGLTHAGVIIEW